MISSHIGEKIIAQLIDDDENNRIMAASLLTKFGQSVLPKLVDTLSDFDDDDERWLLPAAILIEIGKPASNILTKGLEMKSDPARSRIIWILGQIAGNDAIETLCAILVSEDVSVVKVTIDALCKIGKAEVRKWLSSPKSSSRV